GTVTVTNSFNNGTAPFTINGATATDTPTLVLSGGSSTGLTTLIVGSTRSGTMTVTGNGTLNATNLTVGSAVGGAGSVNIFSGTILLSASPTPATIGSAGTGSLVIQGNSATILNTNNGSLYAGNLAGSSGTIDVNGGALLTGSGVFSVGYGGTGTLLVRTGGT